MNILFLTEIIPYPLDSGGKIDTYYHLVKLSKKHSVTVVCFRPPNDNEQIPLNPNITWHFIRSEKCDFSYRDSRLSIIRKSLSFTPFLFLNATSQYFREQTNLLLKQNHFDAIYIDHLNMTQYLPDKKTTQWIFREQNIESILMMNLRKHSTSLTSLLFRTYETTMLKIVEKKILNKFDRILAISSEDLVILQSWKIKAKISLQPPLIGLKHQFKTPKLQPSIKTLYFFGNLHWPPNSLAIQWFLESIWPILSQKFPLLEIKIIGDYRAQDIKRLKSIFHCQFLGYVPDLRPYQESDNGIVLLPFHVGGGVRIKALLAMAHGQAIVSTSIGVRGLSIAPDKHYLLANTPQQFIEKVTILLTNQKTRHNIICNAYNYVSKKHILYNPGSLKKPNSNNHKLLL